jgi:DNA-binding transcriptional MerR regulator
MESLDVSAPLFGVAEVAEVSGVSRPNIDLLVSQKLVRPTRRIKAARPASAKSRGKPMFSVRAIFIVRLIRELHSLGLSYADSAAIADQTEKAKLPLRTRISLSPTYLMSRAATGSGLAQKALSSRKAGSMRVHPA